MLDDGVEIVVPEYPRVEEIYVWAFKVVVWKKYAFEFVIPNWVHTPLPEEGS